MNNGYTGISPHELMKKTASFPLSEMMRQLEEAIHDCRAFVEDHPKHKTAKYYLQTFIDIYATAKRLNGHV